MPSTPWSSWGTHALARQGRRAHSLTINSHRRPSQPSGQTHCASWECTSNKKLMVSVAMVAWSSDSTMRSTQSSLSSSTPSTDSPSMSSRSCRDTSTFLRTRLRG